MVHNGRWIRRRFGNAGLFVVAGVLAVLLIVGVVLLVA